MQWKLCSDILRIISTTVWPYFICNFFSIVFVCACILLNFFLILMTVHLSLIIALLVRLVVFTGISNKYLNCSLKQSYKPVWQTPPPPPPPIFFAGPKNDLIHDSKVIWSEPWILWSVAHIHNALSFYHFARIWCTSGSNQQGQTDIQFTHESCILYFILRL